MGFFDSLFGVDDARRDLRRSKRKSDAALAEGYEGAQGRYDEAFGILTPYAERGREGYDTYTQAIGLGTPEERTDAQDRYFSDPAMSRIVGQDSNRLLRQLNARGSTYGGKAALAGARVGLDNYNRWLDRLSGVGTQGAQFAGQQAGIRTGQGDMDFGYGATRAGNEISFGNAMSATRGQGINNLLDFTGNLAKAGATAFASDIRLKRDIERVGEMPSGLPVYTFRYLWSDEPYMGVMAQEALEYAPHAVITDDPSGYLLIDYAAL